MFKEIISNLPFEKLTGSFVLIIILVIIIATAIIKLKNNPKNEIAIDSDRTSFKGTEIGNLKTDSNNNKTKIELKNSNFMDSKIGCIENDKKTNE